MRWRSKHFFLSFLYFSIVSIANDFACKSLDWLENALPVLQSPTDMVTFPLNPNMHLLEKNIKNGDASGLVLSPSRSSPLPGTKCMRSRAWLQPLELWSVYSTLSHG